MFRQVYNFNTPVLYYFFIRFDTVKKVFAQIRQIKPKYLYLASDGPRLGRAGEEEKVRAIREYVLAQIDWPCQVKTLFRKKNLGADKAIVSTLNWFFANVEQGIILEEDCLPSLSFFLYCAELLARYKDDLRVYNIAGYMPLRCGKKFFAGYDYAFSGLANCWGWATWRRAWKNYALELEGLSEFIQQKKIDQVFSNKKIGEFYLRILQNCARHPAPSSWDYRWSYSIMKNGGICISPAKNLVSNIGFDLDAVNCISIFNSRKKCYELSFPLRSPPPPPR